MKLDKISNIECFVFDMDGTVYLEDILLDGALDMFNYFNENNIPYYFLTNNSSKSGKSYLRKLHSLSMRFVKRDQIITSGDITIKYVKEQFGKNKIPKIYLVGTDELKQDFVKEGIHIIEGDNEEIDAVVVGFDTSLTYEKVSIATRYIRKGIPFISTHIDLVCPIKNGEFIPDCGAITKMIEASTGVKAKYLGKPNKETVDYLVDTIKIDKRKIAIVGDRLYTDVATGINNGMIGIAVLTGETSLTEIEKSSIKPSYVFKDVSQLHKLYMNKTEVECFV